jgi:hypothetical protein
MEKRLLTTFFVIFFVNEINTGGSYVFVMMHTIIIIFLLQYEVNNVLMPVREVCV